jgi:hypothetical protein
VIALIAIKPSVVLFIMFGVYALSGPVGWTWAKATRKSRDAGAAGGAA